MQASTRRTTLDRAIRPVDTAPQDLKFRRPIHDRCSRSPSFARLSLLHPPPPVLGISPCEILHTRSQCAYEEVLSQPAYLFPRTSSLIEVCEKLQLRDKVG